MKPFVEYTCITIRDYNEYEEIPGIKIKDKELFCESDTEVEETKSFIEYMNNEFNKRLKDEYNERCRLQSIINGFCEGLMCEEPKTHDEAYNVSEKIVNE